MTTDTPVHMSAGRKSRPQGGAQSIRRTIAILRSVSRHNDTGVRLSNIAREVDLPSPTVHRILSVLLEEEFLAFDPAGKLYHVGPELYSMGASTHHFAIQDRFHSTIRQITDQTRDATYLVIRSGNDGMCIDRSIGKWRIQVLGYEIGERRPLGMGAAGLSLLSFLPKSEREAVLSANTPRYKKYYDIKADDVRPWIRETRKQKYSRSVRKITHDFTGIGAPIFNKKGQVVAAISMAATATRMTPERCREIAGIILSEIAAIDPPD